MEQSPQQSRQPYGQEQDGGGGLVQTPFSHVCVLEQAWPHVPQLCVSHDKFVQPPAQQVGVLPEQTCPHVPQLVGLVDVLTHAPLE